MDINRQRLIIFMFFSILLFNLRTGHSCELKAQSYFNNTKKLKSSHQIKRQFKKCKKEELLALKKDLKISLKKLMIETSELSRNEQRMMFQSQYYLLALLDNQIQ